MSNGLSKLTNFGLWIRAKLFTSNGLNTKVIKIFWIVPHLLLLIILIPISLLRRNAELKQPGRRLRWFFTSQFVV